jgi:hypothetical protein
MSVADLLPAIQLLPRAEKEQLYRFLADDLARKRDTALEPVLFVPPQQDHCPYSPEELTQSFQEEGPGVPLTEIWKKLGRT